MSRRVSRRLKRDYNIINSDDSINHRSARARARVRDRKREGERGGGGREGLEGLDRLKIEKPRNGSSFVDTAQLTLREKKKKKNVRAR